LEKVNEGRAKRVVIKQDASLELGNVVSAIHRNTLLACNKLIANVAELWGFKPCIYAHSKCGNISLPFKLTECLLLLVSITTLFCPETLD
jgi:hypothetical protein